MKMLYMVKKSLSIKVISILVVTVIPVIIALFAINYYAIYQVRNEIFMSSLNTLTVHMEQIDSQMSSSGDYIRMLDSEEMYVAAFESEDLTVSYYAANYYQRTLRLASMQYNYIDAFYVYSPVSDLEVYINNNSGDNYQNRRSIIENLKTQVMPEWNNSREWISIKNDGKCYFVNIYKIKDTYFCTWTSVDTLMIPIQNWKISESGIVLFASNEGQAFNNQDIVNTQKLDLSGSLEGYYYSGDDNQSLIIGVESDIGSFRLMEILDSHRMTLPYMRILYVAAAIFILFLICIPIIYRMLHKNIFGPMNKMQTAISEVDRGNLEYHIEKEESNIQFGALITSFNSMIRQIKNLKIKAYEDELAGQQMELQFLQVQVEPHFYLNTLNTINAMAQMGENHLIQELSKNLSEYLRYIAGSKMDLVTVQRELNHIEKYTQILRTRYYDKFQLAIDVEAGLDQEMIPPLLIQTLVENSMKYAFDVYKENYVRIRIFHQLQDNKEGFCITTEDNGKGYPENILKAVNEKQYHLIANEKIGLLNARKRLFYMCGDSVRFVISNKPEGGAVTTVWIPKGESIPDTRRESINDPKVNKTLKKRIIDTFYWTDRLQQEIRASGFIK